NQTMILTRFELEKIVENIKPLNLSEIGSNGTFLKQSRTTDSLNMHAVLSSAQTDDNGAMQDILKQIDDLDKVLFQFT
ncbi:MAG: hypothetical protein MHPSP_001525, partial [Paramarteilia canceri]